MSNTVSTRIERMEDSDFESLLIWTSLNPALQDLRESIAIVGYTGLRFREFTNLRWIDVEFEHRRLIVPSQRYWKRWVPIGKKTMAALSARRDRHPDARFVFSPVPSNIGIRLRRQLRESCSSLNIAAGTFGALRKAVVYKLVRTWDSVSTTCYMLGYADPVFSKSTASVEQMFEHAAELVANLEGLGGGTRGNLPSQDQGGEPQKVNLINTQYSDCEGVIGIHSQGENEIDADATPSS